MLRAGASERAGQHQQGLPRPDRSFGHGCNNVSNAVGPLAAIYGVWLSSSVAAESQVPVW